MRNLRITINRIHIRYEDDFFAMSSFACGILCDQIISYGSPTEWEFGTLSNNKFNRVTPKYLSYNIRNPENLMIRETNAAKLRVYWKSCAEMIIPNSLWESTKDLDQQIFDAIPLEDMCHMMKQSFSDDNLIEPFDFYTNVSYRMPPKRNIKDFKADVLFTKIDINVNPKLIDDISSFKEHASNILIMKQLKNYRPLNRPITNDKRLENNAKLKRKKLLTVRDWFFYAVWATRIKQTFNTICNRTADHNDQQAKINKLHRKLIEKAKLMRKSQKWNKVNFNDVNDAIKVLKGKINSKNEEEEFFEFQCTFRCQETSLRIFSDNLNARCIGSVKKPIIELQLTVFYLYII